MSQQERKVLVEVKDVSKKFCKDLKANMYYGIKDVVRQTFGLSPHNDSLRQHEFWALNGVSFNVHEGEILAVIGANGSGKTTLMRLISGIYSIDKGQININGVGKTTAIFALNAGMNPLFTGLENIYLKGAMFGLTKKELQEKLDFIIEFSELKEFLNSPVGNYSSGMKARLAYSVAIATEPNLFIIDEALAVGDSLFKAKCYEHLQEYVKQPNKAVIYVTNRIRKVMAVASRVVILDKGKLIYDNTNATEALEFYINNCLQGLSEELRETRLRRVQEFEM
ncbi:MAG: ABC transporter ATP-binding protein [Lewinellaceae bacterium]|nr:ABC transporter ATP-binding protein [Lewinellaceae bacterium]